MTEQVPPPPSTPEKKKNRRRSNKMKAEEQFDVNAKPKTLEKFFSDVIEDQRENVEIELHLDVDQRITDGFTDRIETFVEYSSISADKTDDEIKARVSNINSITDVAIAKKLWTATPESERTNVEPLKYLRNMDIQLPKSINIAVDQLGKVTDDEWICRIKHNSLTIERYLVRALQFTSDDPKFFDSNFRDSFQDDDEVKKFLGLDVSKIFTTSNDSVAFLREYAQSVLTVIMNKTFEVRIGQNDHIINVSYPKLEFGKTEAEDRQNIIDWMALLSVNHPDWELAADAAILRLINLPWLKRKKDKLTDLDPIFTESIWKDRTLEEVFKNLDLTHLDEFKKLKVRNSVQDFLFWYQKKSVPLFKRMFNMSTMSSSSSFGAKAQLIVLSDFTKLKKSTGEFYTVANGAEGSSYFRLKEKGSIVQNMIYGFTRSIKISENYKYRTNGSPSSIKSSNIAGDMRD
jgi:hypothetical protein